MPRKSVNEPSELYEKVRCSMHTGDQCATCGGKMYVDRFAVSNPTSKWIITQLINILDGSLVTSEKYGSMWIQPAYVLGVALDNNFGLFPHPFRGLELDIGYEGDRTHGDFIDVLSDLPGEEVENPYQVMRKIFGASGPLLYFESDTGFGFAFNSGFEPPVFALLDNLEYFVGRSYDEIKDMVKVRGDFSTTPNYEEIGYARRMRDAIMDILVDESLKDVPFDGKRFPISRSVIAGNLDAILVPERCEKYRDFFNNFVDRLPPSYNDGDSPEFAIAFNSGEIWTSERLDAKYACAISDCLGLGRLYFDENGLLRFQSHAEPEPRQTTTFWLSGEIAPGSNMLQ